MSRSAFPSPRQSDSLWSCPLQGCYTQQVLTAVSQFVLLVTRTLVERLFVLCLACLYRPVYTLFKTTVRHILQRLRRCAAQHTRRRLVSPSVLQFVALMINADRCCKLSSVNVLTVSTSLRARTSFLTVCLRKLHTPNRNFSWPIRVLCLWLWLPSGSWKCSDFWKSEGELQEIIQSVILTPWYL
jgi:hypothetical protein